jgi:hypothetical protein
MRIIDKKNWNSTGLEKSMNKYYKVFDKNFKINDLITPIILFEFRNYLKFADQ